jgi:hypothetical protein
LRNFENRLSSILYNYNSLDEAESILNKTINCLEVAERDAPKIVELNPSQQIADLIAKYSKLVKPNK